MQTFHLEGSTIMNVKRTLLAAFLLAAMAVSAIAWTASELQQHADTLQGAYADLLARAQACAGGNCSERQDIESNVIELESSRTQLHSDREALGTCTNCGMLDSAISQVDEAASDVQEVVSGWDGLG